MNADKELLEKIARLRREMKKTFKSRPTNQIVYSSAQQRVNYNYFWEK